MESVEVIAFLGCALLALAGAFKMKDPAPTVGAMRALHLPASLMSVRLMGFVEVVIGLVAALTGSAIAMGLVGIAYVAFVLIVEISKSPSFAVLLWLFALARIAPLLLGLER